MKKCTMRSIIENDVWSSRKKNFWYKPYTKIKDVLYSKEEVKLNGIMMVQQTYPIIA